MAVTNQNVNFGLQIGDFLESTNKVITGFGGQAQSLEQLINAGERYNRNEKLLHATIQTKIDDNNKLAVAIGRATKAQQEAGLASSQGLIVKSFTVKPVEKTPPKPFGIDPEQINVQAIANAIAINQRLKDSFPAPNNATIGQLSKYESQLGRIGQLIASGKVSKQRFDEISQSINAGKGITSLSGNELKLGIALKGLTDGFKEVSEASKTFGLNRESAFRIVEALLLKDAIGGLIGQIQQATLTAVKFQIQISEIRTLSQSNQESFQGWSQSIRRVSDALGLPQADVAESAYRALSNQITNGTAETEKFLKSTGEFARVTVTKMSTATDLTSAALQSYQLNLRNTEEVQAKFSKAIDLGRFRADDLASSFGRVSAPAAALGVSLDEVLAALATLTNQGVKADDAQTQLLNVFLKLTKPTEVMQKFLDGIGTSSGQVAIQTFTLAGVLERLEKAAKGDVKVLAELGGELRAIRGLVGLTTRGLGEDFRTNLGKIKGTTLEDFNVLKGIRAESAGDELIKEFNKVKNFFINDFGQAIINSTQQINKSLGDVGGLSGVIKGVSNSLFAGAKIYLIYKTATIASNIVTAAFSLNLKGIGLSSTAAALGITKLTAAQEFQQGVTTRGQKIGAVAGVVGKIGVFALIASEVVDLIKELAGAKDKTDELSEATQKLADKIKAARIGETSEGKDIVLEKFKKGKAQEVDAFKAQVDDTFKVILERLAISSKSAHDDLIVIRSQALETSRDLAQSFTSVTGHIKDTIRAYAENISKAKTSITQAKKNIVDLTDTVDELLLKFKQRFASPEQQFLIRNEEIARLKDKITKVATVGGENAEAELKELGNRLLHLVDEQETAKADLVLHNEELKRKYLFQTHQITLQQANQPIITSSQKIRNELEETARFVANAQNALIKSKEKEIKVNKNLEVSAEGQSKRFAEEKTRFDHLVEIRDKAGRLKPEFQTQTGEFDKTKFLPVAQKSADLLLKIFDETSIKGKTIEEQLEHQVQRQKLVKLLKEEINNLLHIEGAELVSQNIQRKQLLESQRQEKVKSIFEKSANAEITFREGAVELSKEVGAVGVLVNNIIARAGKDSNLLTIGEGEEPFKKASLKAKAALEAFFADFGKGTISPTDRAVAFNKNKDVFKEVAENEARILELTKQAQQVDERGRPIAGAREVNTIRQLNEANIAALNRAFSDFTGKVNNKDFAIPGGQTLAQLEEVKDRQTNELGAFIQRTKLLIDQQDALKNNLNEFATRFNTSVENNTKATLLYTDSIIKFAETLRREQQLNVPQGNVPNFNKGPGMHFGGLLTGPKGNDNLLIRAEAGEFIMNQISTKKWLPQLIQMNKGIAPKIPGHYHEGGFVQTSVGDVNVTITGPVSPQKNIREIGQALRREIRRGNLNLNKE